MLVHGSAAIAGVGLPQQALDDHVGCISRARHHGMPAPMVASRLPVVALDSSDARMPKPRRLMYLAVPCSSSVKELLPMLSGRQAALVTHACPLKALRRAWHPACTRQCAGQAPSEGARASLLHEGRPASGRRQVPAEQGLSSASAQLLLFNRFNISLHFQELTCNLQSPASTYRRNGMPRLSPRAEEKLNVSAEQFFLLPASLHQGTFAVEVIGVECVRTVCGDSEGGRREQHCAAHGSPLQAATCSSAVQLPSPVGLKTVFFEVLVSFKEQQRVPERKACLKQMQAHLLYY